MMMKETIMTNTSTKAGIAFQALQQLHEELDLGTTNTNRQRKAINDYLDAASTDSLARLYDILVSGA